MTQKTSPKKKAQKKSPRATQIDLIAEINKIENAQPEDRQEIEILTKAQLELEKIDKRRVAAQLDPIIDQINDQRDLEKEYKTKRARKLAALVDGFGLLAPGKNTQSKVGGINVKNLKYGPKDLAELNKANWFQVTVNRLNSENETVKKAAPDYDKGIIEELKSLLPDCVGQHITTTELKDRLEKLKEKGNKMTHKAYKYVQTFIKAGKANDGLVTKNGKKYKIES